MTPKQQDITRRKLEDTERVIARTEESLRRYPHPATEVNLMSLEKMKRRLLRELADSNGV